MIYNIKAVKERPFDSNGETVPYFWYKAVRQIDGVTIEFGSKKDDLEVGEEYDLDIEKTERPNGKFGYRRVA